MINHPFAADQKYDYEKIALLEKTKTPYRPPFFEYLGKYSELTVFYAGTEPEHRQWNTDHIPNNYTEVHLQTREVGPFTVAPGLRQYLISDDYDTIIGNADLSMLFNSYLGLYAAKVTGSRFVVWSEIIDTQWKQGRSRSLIIQNVKKISKPGVAQVRRRLFRSADRVVAYSRLAARAAEKIGVSRDSITTAPQWYPPQILSKPDTDPSTSSYRILYIGSLSERKGVDVLIQAAKDHGLQREIRFVIAGDGPLRGLVSTSAKDYQNIEYLGYITEKQKANELAAADLFVLPSRHDPWGLVINEAYLFDTPAVTTYTAGAEMIVPSELTAPPGNADILFDILEYAEEQRPTAPAQPSVEEMAEPLIRDIRKDPE